MRWFSGTFYMHLGQRGEDSGEQNVAPKRTNNQQPSRSTQRPQLHNTYSSCGFIWTPQACSHVLKFFKNTHTHTQKTFHLRKVSPLGHDKEQQQDWTEYRDLSRIGPNHEIPFPVVAFVTNKKSLKNSSCICFHTFLSHGLLKLLFSFTVFSDFYSLWLESGSQHTSRPHQNLLQNPSLVLYSETFSSSFW